MASGSHARDTFAEELRQSQTHRHAGTDAIKGQVHMLMENGCMHVRAIDAFGTTRHNLHAVRQVAEHLQRA